MSTISETNDLNKAYEALGLPVDASREDIEHRYGLLMRQARAQQRRGEVTIDEAAVHRAYRLIIEEQRRQAIEQYELEKYGSDKRAQTAEKVDHFIHYYKFHVIFAIIALILIIMGVKSYLDKSAEKARLAALPPAEVSVIFMGHFAANFPDIEETLLSFFPNWLRIDAQIHYVTVEPRDQYEIAMLQKSVITLMSERPDIYIMDRANFERVAKQGLFIPLEGIYMGGNDVLADKGNILYLRAEDDTKEHAYGVYLRNMPDMIPGLGYEMIAGITVHSENTSNALKFMKQFMP